MEFRSPTHDSNYSPPSKKFHKTLHVRGALVDDRVRELVGRNERAVQVTVDLERRLDVRVEELGRYVHLRDATLYRAPDVRERSSAAAMQDERRVGKSVGDCLAARDVELRLRLVVAVSRSNRHRKRVYASVLRKGHRFVDIGKRGLVALRDMANLAFARRAERVRVVHDELRPLYVLFVGRATQRKLYRYGILTIGDLAGTDPFFLQSVFGKIGLVLSAFARGEDRTPVAADGSEIPVKSIGNSTTTPRDLTTEQDVKMVVYMLAESVASRLRRHGFAGDVVEIYVRDGELRGFSRQHKVDMPTNISEEIAREAMRLFRENYSWERPVRSIGVRVTHLKMEDHPYQISLFTSPEWREKQLKADLAVDEIRDRFGFQAVRRGLMHIDTKLSADDAETHVVHPHGYFERGNRSGV